MLFDELLKRLGFALFIQRELANSVLNDERIPRTYCLSRPLIRPLKIRDKQNRESESEHYNRYEQQ
jgi:hypothetical protein